LAQRKTGDPKHWQHPSCQLRGYRTRWKNRLLGPGETGEVVVRGNLVMKGYYKNPEETAKVSEHGWRHTGDVGYKDEDGYVYLVDRKKDMIISGGFNVYPNEVEQVILAHSAV